MIIGDSHFHHFTTARLTAPDSRDNEVDFFWLERAIEKSPIAQYGAYPHKAVSGIFKLFITGCGVPKWSTYFEKSPAEFCYV